MNPQMNNYLQEHQLKTHHQQHQPQNPSMRLAN